MRASGTFQLAATSATVTRSGQRSDIPIPSQSHSTALTVRATLVRRRRRCGDEGVTGVASEARTELRASRGAAGCAPDLRSPARRKQRLLDPGIGADLPVP